MLFVLLVISIYLAEGWISSCLGYPRLSRTRLKVGRIKEIKEIEGRFNSTTFASTQCWGESPLLLRKSFDSEEFPSWDDIMDLACSSEDEEEAITSRLIQHTPNTLDTFRVEFGPFNIEELEKAMKNDKNQASTLVVNDVDRWIPSLSDWMDATFGEFLPRWRRDDAQISLARTGGGIGPHVDNYDVFLIQTSGKREWEVGLERISVEKEFSSLVEASEVRIMNISSVPSIKFELNVGDCLYLPPRYPHWGVSTASDCMTLSVGCRAPSAVELFSKMSELLLSTSSIESAVKRYTDIDLFQQTNDKSLSINVKNKMKSLVMDLVEETLRDEAIWDDIVGRMATQPNRPIIDYPTPLSLMDEGWKAELGIWADAEKSLDTVLNGTGVLRRAEGISFAWSSRSDPPSFTLYAQGRVFTIHNSPPTTALLLDCIANGPALNQNTIHDLGIEITQSVKDFILDLLEEGLLYGDVEHPPN